MPQIIERKRMVMVLLALGSNAELRLVHVLDPALLPIAAHASVESVAQSKLEEEARRPVLVVRSLPPE
jgi:hypothetical protein